MKCEYQFICSSLLLLNPPAKKMFATFPETIQIVCIKEQCNFLLMSYSVDFTLQ